MLKKTSPVKPEESPVKEESPDKMDSSVRAESPLVTELVKSQVNNLKILYGNILKENFLFPPPKKKQYTWPEPTCPVLTVVYTI